MFRSENRPIAMMLVLCLTGIAIVSFCSIRTVHASAGLTCLEAQIVLFAVCLLCGYCACALLILIAWSLHVQPTEKPRCPKCELVDGAHWEFCEDFVSEPGRSHHHIDLKV